MRDVTFDTETTGLHPYEGDWPFLVQVANDANPDGVFGVLGEARNHPVAAGGRPDAYVPSYLKALVNTGDRLVGHNAPFDHHHLTNVGWKLKLPIADTRELWQIVAPERRFGPKSGTDAFGNYVEDGLNGYHLKDLAVTNFDPHAKDGEAELERLAQEHGFSLKARPDQKGYMPSAYYVLWQLEPDAMEFYAREDVRLTRGILKVGESKLTDEHPDEFGRMHPGGTRQAWELEQKLLPVIIDAEQHGIRVDGEKAVPLRQQYSLAAEQAKDQLDHELGDEWSQNNDALAEALVKVGVPLRETTDNGQLAVNAKALGAFEDDYPIIKTLFEYRQADKFVHTYLDHLVGREVIHPTFSPMGAWTSRMSGREPNMQNIPVHAGTAVRELFLPRPGMAFVGIDFEQIELRLLGYYLHNEELTRRIEDEDFFAWVASQTPRKPPYAEWRGDPSKFHKGTDGAEWRQTNKNATYAIVYGVGGLKLGKMLGWPADAVYGPNDWVVRKGYKKVGDPRNLEAEAFIKQIKSILTGYYHLTRDRIEPKVKRYGAVDTIYGYHQWVGYDGAWKALSGLIQGGAAGLFKAAVIAAAAAIEPYGAYPVLFIHDELVMETPIENAERVLEVASEAMTGIRPGFRPRIAVEGHIAYNNWGEAK
jgi:DNA polymerase I-like protein with 3'-5' exonuclease and polymerase domains